MVQQFMINPSFSQVTQLSVYSAILAVSLVLATHCVPTQAGLDTACSPKSSHRSCVMGCWRCTETYGRKVYDMAACCSECQQSGALLLDEGPEFCSDRFFTDNAAANIVKRETYAKAFPFRRR